MQLGIAGPWVGRKSGLTLLCILTNEKLRIHLRVPSQEHSNTLHQQRTREMMELVSLYVRNSFCSTLSQSQRPLSQYSALSFSWTKTS